MNWADSSQRRTFAFETASLAIRATGVLTPKDDLVALAVATQSPIEAIFSTWFTAARDHLLAEGFTRFAVSLEPQLWVDTYRLDFAIQPNDPAMTARLRAAGLDLRLGIELDGHEFHERTRDQVTRRNQRDRRLADLGWLLLHFSGSELLPNPMHAVVEALEAGAYALDQATAALDHKGD